MTKLPTKEKVGYKKRDFQFYLIQRFYLIHRISFFITTLSRSCVGQQAYLDCSFSSLLFKEKSERI